ncbi:hypothetical protein LZC95_46205 [Pendulispora brunnea]|uniref:Lipoprotein n=1 Tax=Pendulispora brunnea TaxID=2905690 RepID=A0ABZ2K565_9BACT
MRVAKGGINETSGGMGRRIVRKVAPALAILILGASACASSTQTAHPDDGVKGARPGEPEIAYRARIVIGGRSEQIDKWTDIVVLGGGEPQRQGCEALLKDESKRLAKTGARISTERVCALMALPNVPAVYTGPSFVERMLLRNENRDHENWLIDRRAMTDMDLAMAAASAGDNAAPPEDSFSTDTVAEVITYTRFASGSACSDALHRLLQKKREKEQEEGLAIQDFFQSKVDEFVAEQDRANREQVALRNKCSQLRMDSRWDCRNTVVQPVQRDARGLVVRTYDCPNPQQRASELESCERALQAAEAKSQGAQRSAAFFRDRANRRHPRAESIEPICQEQ